jgi:hypothetical protein
MGMTPEGRVKHKVKGILDQYPSMYYYMPVQTGYGQATLDFIGCYNRLFFSIETKTEGKAPTDRQKVTMSKMLDAHGEVFVVAGTDNTAIAPLVHWLEHNRPTSHDPRPHQPSA